MEGLAILFCLALLSPLLPFVALVGTGILMVTLQVIGVLAFERV